MTMTPEEDRAFLELVSDRSGVIPLHRPGDTNGASPQTDGTAPAEALAAVRVNLIDIIRHGIPERTYVPGCQPWLISAKRYLLPAPAGTGKSLAGLIVAVEVIDNGGSVAILDVENGAEEYAARLADILADRPDKVAQACSERLRYYAWPALRTDWSADEWAAALHGVDLVIFDSSRLILSAASLAEDSNDDYAKFVNTLLIPLTRAGITPMVLDNTGHEERDRARGASTKSDLNEVVYVVKVGKPFDRDKTGELHLHRTRTRFSDLPMRLTMTVGGGTYRAPVPAVEDTDSGEFRPTTLMERVSRFVEGEPGATRNAIQRGVSGKGEYIDVALRILVTEKHIERRAEGQAQRHYSLIPYRENTDRVPESQPSPDRVPDPVRVTESPSPPLIGDPGLGTRLQRTQQNQPSPGTRQETLT